jgi:hypothetical protein
LSTLAVPETGTGELIVVLASGLSMMIFRLPAMGVAAVVGSEELAGAALVLADAEAEAFGDAPLAVGDPLSSTKVVVLSPPQPDSATATNAANMTPNPFITLSNGSAPQRLRLTLSRRLPAERIIVRARDR